MRRYLVIALSLAGLAIFVFLGKGAPVAAAGPTPVCGSLATTTWTLANSPYVVCNTGATVPATATLTIQPGVVVQFNAGVNNKLNVQGALSALGTAAQPITFTGVTTSAGSWSGLSVDNTTLAPASAALDYITVDFGGAGSDKADVFVDHGVLTLTRSLIRDSLTNGLYAAQHALLTVDTTRFVNNAQDAVQLADPGGNLPLTNLTASGNLNNAVHITGLNTAISGQVRWSNPGLPYLIDVLMSNGAGDVLTIDPGTEMRFGSNDGLTIGGALIANGQPGQPITFTAQTKAPGMWRGILVQNPSAPATAQLDYATVEYGGQDFNGANLNVDAGLLAAHHTVVRFSAKDGVRFGSQGQGSILNSQIVSNDQVVTSAYGVENVNTTRAVLATNNWWGDPSGPASDNAQCPVGHGDRISNYVAARPVLTSTTAVNEFPLSNAPQLELSPRRWFAPADGVTRVYFDITLRDGNGAPLPGRTVKLTIVSGTAAKADGGVTDATGHTLAYITSNTADADVDVSASLATNACEFSVSPVSRVHFTQLPNFTDLFPNSPAPYVNTNVDVRQRPLVAGITATISARLQNPLTVPITVDVHFEIVQASIGLAFGPIADFTGQVIPAGGSLTLSTPWLPPVSGHYCIRVAYSITGGVLSPLPQSPAFLWFTDDNENVGGGSSTPSGGKDSLDKANKLMGAGKHLAPATHQVMIGGWWDAVSDATRKISQALGFDPPRQDYTVISVPISTTWTAVSPGPGVTPARATAINAASAALVNVLAYGQAASIALDRYGGAAAAGDLTWEAQQMNAQQYYQQQMGQALIDYADKLDALVLEVNTEGYTDTVVSLAEAAAFQTRLSTTGFTAQEITDAHNAGLSNADIEAYKQELLAADPSDLSGDLRDVLTAQAAGLRAAGSGLLHPYNFVPSASVSGTAGQAPTAGSGNSMVQIYNSTSTILVSNTFTVPMTLSVRRINLPADWSAQVSPAQVAPGQQVTATVKILAGSPVPQGSLLRVAVEGWVGSQLAGGVAVDVMAPLYILFDGHLRLYLPLVRR